MLSIKEITDHKSDIKYILICNYRDKSQFLPVDFILTRISISYTGSMTNDESKNLLGDKDPAILTLNALTNTDNCDKFFYEIKHNENDVNFMWKYSPTSDVKILLGSVNLKHEHSSDTVLLALKSAGEKIRGLEKTNAELELTQNELIGERNKLLSQVEKYATEKEIFEKEMYTKFSMVLNSKKQKCKKLKEALSSMESRSETDLPTEGSKSRRKAPVDEGIDYVDSENSDLDIPEPSQFKRKIQPKHDPSEKGASSSKVSRTTVNYLSSSEDSYDADKLLDAI